jgi:hypothetical protein
MPSLWEFAGHTDQKLEHHRRFWDGLQALLTPEQKKQLEAGGHLYEEIWRRPSASAPSSSVHPMPYYSQVDSATDQGLRMCFSSSNAMLVEALRPGTLTGPNGDDQYLKVVQRYGDTTEVGAQLAALRHFGITARFSDKANWQDLLRAQDKGEVMSLGFLHHGNVSAPTGGGHWLAVVRVAPEFLVVNDPYGEIDLVAGTYLNRQGKGLRYSRLNFEPRWSVKQEGGRWRPALNAGYAIFAGV